MQLDKCSEEEEVSKVFWKAESLMKNHSLNDNKAIKMLMGSFKFIKAEGHWERCSSMMTLGQV